jgi:hypothetical protein
MYRPRILNTDFPVKPWVLLSAEFFGENLPGSRETGVFSLVSFVGVGDMKHGRNRNAEVCELAFEWYKLGAKQQVAGQALFPCKNGTSQHDAGGSRNYAIKEY